MSFLTWMKAMNEDIIRMAREAGFNEFSDGLRDDGSRDIYLDCWPEQLERFAELVRADEREACAKLCISIKQSQPLTNRVGWEHGTIDCSVAIRARGNK
jgi:hypothetical protein